MMTLQLLQSEFTYICGKFDFLFISVAVLGIFTCSTKTASVQAGRPSNLCMLCLPIVLASSLFSIIRLYAAENMLHHGHC
jgi:hypothetical protein